MLSSMIRRSYNIPLSLVSIDIHYYLLHVHYYLLHAMDYSCITI